MIYILITIYIIGYIIAYRRFRKFVRNNGYEFDWGHFFACLVFGLVWFISLPVDYIIESDLKLPKFLQKPPRWL